MLEIKIVINKMYKIIMNFIVCIKMKFMYVFYIFFYIIINLLENMEKKINWGVLKFNRKFFGEVGVFIVVVKVVVDIEFIMVVDV